MQRANCFYCSFLSLVWDSFVGPLCNWGPRGDTPFLVDWPPWQLLSWDWVLRFSRPWRDSTTLKLCTQVLSRVRLNIFCRCSQSLLLSIDQDGFLTPWRNFVPFFCITGTTIGYGDITPKSDAGKIAIALYAIVSVHAVGILLDPARTYLEQLCQRPKRKLVSSVKKKSAVKQE